MTRTDADAADPPSDAEKPPDSRCVAVANGTGERCRNRAIPGSDRCHAHVGYTELAETFDSDVDTLPTCEETPPGAREQGLTRFDGDDSYRGDGGNDV
jgi:hypothetical protein